MKAIYKLVISVGLMLVMHMSLAKSEMRQFIEFFDKNDPEKF